MMLWHVYLRKGVIFVPTVAKTDAGFFMDIDPVTVVDSANHEGVVDAIKATISKGNPTVATPTRGTFPKPVVLPYANVKSWVTFEKNAFCWKISRNELGFQLRPQRKNFAGGWEDDPGQSRSFDGERSVDELASSIADQVQRLG